jgi:hypothetical protein
VQQRDEVRADLRAAGRLFAWRFAARQGNQPPLIEALDDCSHSAFRQPGGRHHGKRAVAEPNSVLACEEVVRRACAYDAHPVVPYLSKAVA